MNIEVEENEEGTSSKRGMGGPPARRPRSLLKKRRIIRADLLEKGPCLKRQRLVRAVAERWIGAVLALAPPDGGFFCDFVFHRLQAGAFV